MRHWLKTLVTLLVCVFIFPLKSHASENFHVAVIVDYTFNEVGESHVKQQISLTNQTSNLYADSYQLHISGQAPQNLVGFDAYGPLKIISIPQTNSTDTLLQITFNQPVVGKGSTLRFNLEYDAGSATKNGQVWEIVLPKLADADLIDTYLLNLHVPATFGQPAYITPQPESSTPSGTYTFTKDQISKSGAIAAFGNLQTFTFQLSYQLKNSLPKSTTQTITLPPDTAYQKVYYDRIDPKPLNVKTDVDGNWLAEYELKPRQEISITATGEVRVYSNPGHPPIPPPSTSLSEYTRPQKYWESDDPNILALAASLTSPEKIYNYVVDKLNYNPQQLTTADAPKRLGAKKSLVSPDLSLCNEFTDLFIALSRASGIPSRRLIGFAYTTDPSLKPLSLDGDLLHAWPEYWDSDLQTWVSVDPTWGKTSGGIDYFHTFDLNHFVFAINGTNSDSPSSAGEFRTTPNQRDIDVHFGEYQDHPQLPPDISLDKPWQLLPFINNHFTAIIANPQGRAVYHLPLLVTSSGLPLQNDPTTIITVLPPYAVLKIPITLKKTYFPSSSPKLLQIKLESQTMTYNIQEQLFFVWYGLFIFIGSFLVLGLAAIANHAWSLHLQKHSRAHPVRREGQKSEKSG